MRYEACIAYTSAKAVPRMCMESLLELPTARKEQQASNSKDVQGGGGVLSRQDNKT